MDTLHVSKLAEGTEKGNRHFAWSFYFHSTHSLFSQRKITLYLDSQLGGHGKEKEALTWNDRMAFFFSCHGYSINKHTLDIRGIKHDSVLQALSLVGEPVS